MHSMTSATDGEGPLMTQRPRKATTCACLALERIEICSGVGGGVGEVVVEVVVSGGRRVVGSEW